MVEEHSVRCTNRGLAILKWIPGDAEAGSNVIQVLRDALSNSQRVLSCSRERIAGRRCWRELNIVASAIVQRQVRLDPPGVLQEETEGIVREAGMRIAHTLHETLRNAESVCLHGREVGNTGPQEGRGESELYGRKRAEVVQSAEVYGEVGSERNMIHVTTKFHAVIAETPGEVVGHLMALLGAVHERERLTPNESESGNVDGHISSAGPAGEVVEQPPARVLVPELIHFIVSEHPGILRRDGHIAIRLPRCARVGVLSKRLVLAIDLNSRNRTRTHIATQHELLVACEFVIEPEAIYRRPFKHGEVPNLRAKTVKRGGQRGTAGNKCRSSAQGGRQSAVYCGP